MQKKNDETIEKRINIFSVIIISTFLILICALIIINILNNKYYSIMLEEKTNKTYSEVSYPRGKIYDRNYNLLVDNILKPAIYYIKPTNITYKEEIEIAKRVSSYIDVDCSKINNSIFNTYYLINKDVKKYKLNEISPIIYLNSSEEEKETAYIFYLMNNGYSYEKKLIKSKNLTDEELALVSENLDDLPGIYIDYSYERIYLYGDTLKNILGRVSNIPYDDKEYYLENGYNIDDIVGVSFIEKQYEKYLKGTKGNYKIDNNDAIVYSYPERGKDIVLTIDIKLQQEIDKILEEELIKTKKEPSTALFNSAYVVIKDPKNGEILAMSGKKVIKVNGKYEVYDDTVGVITNSMTPGSVVKGASMLVGYSEGAIDIGEKLKDECIKIYSYPRKCSWTKLGTIDDLEALSKSSNVYQFKTALKVANFEYKYNSKLEDVSVAFSKYRKLFNGIGLGSKTGIDLPIDEVGSIGKSTSPDLYLNYVIGQYDTYTTMQLSEYVSTIANYGTRVFPHLLKEVRNSDNNDDIGSIYYTYKIVSNKLNIEDKYIERVRLGFQKVMKDGLGKGFMGDVLNPSGKTGTSESFYDSDNDGIIDTPTLSNAFVGYYPSDNPRMSIAITFPNLVDLDSKSDNRSYANKRITKKISNKFFEIYG